MTPEQYHTPLVVALREWTAAELLARLQAQGASEPVIAAILRAKAARQI